MRWMRGLTLGCVAALAGCLEQQSVDCPGGVICPRETTCARAPVYCAPVEQVAACDGKNIEDFGPCDFGKDEAGNGIGGACRGGACFECSPELAGCTHSGWVAMTSNTTAWLRGIWVASPAEAYAVGDSSIVHYDGFSWREQLVPGVPVGAYFTAVWGSDSDNVFATTSLGGIYRKGVDGIWTEVYQAGATLNAIGGSGPDDVIAVGRMGVVVRLVSGNWQLTTVEGGAYTLHAVAARTRDDVFAAGANGLILHSSGGATWARSQAPMPAVLPPLKAVTTTSTSAFAIGDGGGTSTVMFTLAPSTVSWGQLVVPGVGSTFFHGIWAVSADEVLAVGNGGLIVRYAQGVFFSDTSGTQDLHAIHGTDQRNVFAVGVRGTILHYTGE